MVDQIEMAAYLEELNEKIQTMDENILALEKGENEPNIPNIIEEIFRAAHTIKGSSGMMGYSEIANLTHEIENLFDQLRAGTRQVTRSLIDVILEALDVLKQFYIVMAGNKNEEGWKQIPLNMVMNKLKAALEKKGDTEAKTGEPTPFIKPSRDMFKDIPFSFDLVEENLFYGAKARGFNAYWLNIKLDPDCQMKAVRVFLIFEALKQKGEIIKSIPSFEETQDDNFEENLALLIFSGEGREQIKSLILSIAEVNEVNIQTIDLQEDGQKNLPGEKQKKIPNDREEIVGIKTVRVDVLKLDGLINLVGELLIEHTRLKSFTGRLVEGNKSSLTRQIQDISDHFGQIISSLQEEIMKVRMLPVAYLFNRFPRMVRDIAHNLGKEVELQIEGQQTELDRNIIEAIGNPLIHLLRNAVDHGIEPPEERERLGKPRTGLVKLKAAYLENQIVIIVSDDGRGIKLDKIKSTAVNCGFLPSEKVGQISEQELFNLIFLPGFSTSDSVNDISGRGVGMDIVKKQIGQVNGMIEVFSQKAVGTTFTIKLPLTLAIIRALLVEINGYVYVFPLNNVAEIILIKPEEIKWIDNSKVIEVRQETLSLVEMANLFPSLKPKEIEKEGHIFVVILIYGEQKAGIIVDNLLGEQEVVIKSLGEYLKSQRGFTGAAILGDGNPALIVNVRYFIESISKKKTNSLWIA